MSSIRKIESHALQLKQLVTAGESEEPRPKKPLIGFDHSEPDGAENFGDVDEGVLKWVDSGAGQIPNRTLHRDMVS